VFSSTGVRRGFGALASVAAAAVFAALAAAGTDDVAVTWKQPQDSTRAVKATVECRVDACSVEVKGKLKVPRVVDSSTGEVTRGRTAKLRPDSDELAARHKEKFSLRIPRKARPALRNALASDQTALARLKVLTTEASGQTGRVRAKIKLRERRP
jgi:hypothetical protein